VNSQAADILSPGQRQTLKLLIDVYSVDKGWNRNSLALGYLVGIGFTPSKANRLLGVLLDQKFFG
jgi:hypothetical protein